MSKQETFKKLLSNYFQQWNDLDKEMQASMRFTFYWSLTLINASHVSYKTVDGAWFVKSVYEGGPEWRQDILSCLKKLGRI